MDTPPDSQLDVYKRQRIDRWVDETISGTKVIADRQLGKLLKQIRKGDILITTELSRLGRNLMQVIDVYKRQP